VSEHALDFASADSAMGHAADFALGLALARPARKVICLNGDGSMLMSLPCRIGAAAPACPGRFEVVLSFTR
jgi:thiamine pyrophosphate-dependent acetolactate synthase large subunit-like protein